MKTLKGLYILLRVTFWIAFRILRGRTWNQFFVDLEEPGGRQRYWFKRVSTGYTFEKDPFIRSKL